MLTLVLTAVYFILPAYIANMFPVFAGALRLPFGKPISPKLFGAHKTYRGFYSGFLGAVVVLFLQRYLQEAGTLEGYRLLNYTEINIFFFGFLFGVGAMTGDLIKSFFKRRIGKKEGEAWFPFDQLDLAVGAIVFLYPFYQLEWRYIAVILILTPLLHFLTNVAGYFLGLKKVWW